MCIRDRFVAAHIAVGLAQISEPFMPFSSEKLLRMFNVSQMSWNDIKNEKILVNTGHQIKPAELLFSKIEDETIDFQIQKLENTKLSNAKTNPKATPMKDEIQFDDFTKIDLRTATILAVSYTHLDVYKRQIFKRFSLTFKLFRQMVVVFKKSKR